MSCDYVGPPLVYKVTPGISVFKDASVFRDYANASKTSVDTRLKSNSHDLPALKTSQLVNAADCPPIYVSRTIMVSSFPPDVLWTALWIGSRSCVV